MRRKAEGWKAVRARSRLEGDVFIEDDLTLGKHAFTTSSGGVATETVVPTASFLAITITNDGDLIRLSETGAQDGQILVVINVDATAADTVVMDEVAGQQEQPGNLDISLDQNDTATYMYSSDRSAWLLISNTNN